MVAYRSRMWPNGKRIPSQDLDLYDWMYRVAEEPAISGFRDLFYNYGIDPRSIHG